MNNTTEKPEGLDALIAALTIVRKYGNISFPTHCEHDELWLCGIDPDEMSKVDREAVLELGFKIEDGGFKSYRFGSA